LPLASLYTCTRCKKEYNFNHIRYDDKKNLICTLCFDKLTYAPNAPNSHKPTGQEAVKYICLHCRFNFSIKKGSPKAPKCPYCGKTKLMLVKKYNDANTLIEESMDSKFDY
jgi:DNA-directed RNA polymerase subunit RPC12/RpoP